MTPANTRILHLGLPAQPGSHSLHSVSPCWLNIRIIRRAFKIPMPRQSKLESLAVQAEQEHYLNLPRGFQYEGLLKNPNLNIRPSLRCSSFSLVFLTLPVCYFQSSSITTELDISCSDLSLRHNWLQGD